MQNYTLITLVILMALVAPTSFAASAANRGYIPPSPDRALEHETFDSTKIQGLTTTARLFCYKYTMNGQPITNTATSNAPSTYDASRCIRLPYQGIAVIIAMVGGGSLSINCPSNYPYFRDRREWWAITPDGGFKAGTDAECCALPDYTASGSADWVTPTTPGECP